MKSAPPPEFLGRRAFSAGLGMALMVCAGWIALLNLSRPSFDGWIFWVPITLWLATMGLLCWWTALRAHRPESRTQISRSWRAGWMVGAVGLALGFVGPLLLTPKASLGPLLGILMTGPGGFVLGALGGAVVRWAQGLD